MLSFEVLNYTNNVFLLTSSFHASDLKDGLNKTSLSFNVAKFYPYIHCIVVQVSIQISLHTQN